MAVNRNEMKELAARIHDSLKDAALRALLSEGYEGGEDLQRRAEDAISRQFILMVCASFMCCYGNILPESDGYRSCEDTVRLMRGRFPRIFEDFHETCVTGMPEAGEIWESLGALMEENCEEEGPQIMGWLYQFFISGEHDRAVDALKRKKISKEEIPAATQLFTADWVVRYLLDNSLGLGWINSHPGSHLEGSLQYLVMGSDGEDRMSRDSSGGELMSVFDPCVGSGNFLIYAFDLLMAICRECGLPDREAVSEILSRQLFGTDIDERVVAMARFSLMMKAVRFDPDLTEDVVCENVITIRESGHDVKRLISLLGEKQGDLSAALQELADIYENAAEYGSITVLDSLDTAVLPLLRQAVSEGAASGTPGSHRALEMIRQTEILSRRYDVVVTNPPYLSRYGEKLKEYVSRHYPSFKKDLFGVFIRRCSRMMKENGYLGMMTPMVWMFIRSYEPLRRFIVSELSVQTLTQMEYSAFDDATVPICAFVLRGSSDKNEGTYFRLADFTGGMQVQKEKLLAAVADISCPYRYVTNKKVFSLLPGTCFAYWISPGMLSVFEKGTPLGGMAFPKQGLATTDNGKYLRLWHEVDFCSIAFGMKDTRQAASSGRKWFPYNKGGDFRKWYGNNDYVVDYENDGESIKASVMEKYPYLKNYGYVVKNTEFYFRPCASWSLISSSDTAFRFKPEGFIFDVAGMSLFSDEHLYFLLALCNSSVAREILRIIAPTINFQCGDIARIPVIMPDKETEERITALAEENMELCREDWDSFETSWDFIKHPLV